MAAAMPQEVHSEDYLLRKVFGNTLVFGRVSKHLSLSELQTLSEVSKTFLEVVRNCKEYKEKSRLIISKESYPTVRKTNFQWTSVQIHFGTILGKTELVPLKRILRHVEDIEIKANDNEDVFYTISNTKWVNSLEVFLSNSPNLKKLSLHYRLITKKFINVIKKTKVSSALGKLEKLAIVKPKLLVVPVIEADEQEDFGKVIEELQNKTNNLTDFRFGKIDTRRSECINKELVSIVEKNKNTLTTLSLGIQCWRIEQLKLESMACPYLSSLSIVFKSRDTSVVESFLRNQPAVTSLSIQALDNFPQSLILELKAKVSILQKLHLKTPTLFADEETDENAGDWSFLSAMERLEDFSIIRAVDIELNPVYDENNTLEYISLSNVLNNLPTTVKKIHICGLELAWEIEEDETVGIITTLSRFTQLQELSIFECPNAINDEILQFICSTFTKLKVFEFSKCNTLTSFGFTGVREGLNTGISLKALKGLRKLTINDCTLEVEDQLLDSIQFLELTHLELGYDPDHSTFRISIEFAKRLARQNPSLEYIVGPFEGSDEEISRIGSEIREFRRRFKTALNKFADYNSDCMTAYGFDDDGNRTPWMDNASWGSGVMDFDDLDDDYYDDYDHYDDEFGDFDDSDYGGDDVWDVHIPPDFQPMNFLLHNANDHDEAIHIDEDVVDGADDEDIHIDEDVVDAADDENWDD